MKNCWRACTVKCCRWSAKTSPFVDWPREKSVSFLKPRLVAQVSYSEITSDVKVRQAVFLGLRDDKAAKDIRTPG